MLTSFIHLPRDIKYSIARLLSLPDLLALICCHKSLLSLVTDEKFWYHKFKHDFQGKIFAKPETFTFKAWYQITKILNTETDPYELGDKSTDEFDKSNYEESALLMMMACIYGHMDIEDCLWDIDRKLTQQMMIANPPLASTYALELYPKVVSYLKDRRLDRRINVETSKFA